MSAKLKKIKDQTKEVFWREGSRYTIPPEVAAAELERIGSQNPNGAIKPADVVAAARDPRNVLHTQFNWDDSDAAEQYRISQARKLISSIQIRWVKLQPESHEQQVTKAYYSIRTTQDDSQPERTETPGQRSYIPAARCLTDPEARAQLVMMAKADAAQFRRRYQSLEILCEVFSAFERVPWDRGQAG